MTSTPTDNDRVVFVRALSGCIDRSIKRQGNHVKGVMLQQQLSLLVQHSCDTTEGNDVINAQIYALCARVQNAVLMQKVWNTLRESTYAEHRGAKEVLDMALFRYIKLQHAKSVLPQAQAEAMLRELQTKTSVATIRLSSVLFQKILRDPHKYIQRHVKATMRRNRSQPVCVPTAASQTRARGFSL